MRGREKPAKQATERLQQEIARLEHELTGTRDYLQSIIETQEAAAEELRSSNEEAQANNEELDTAKEELQASNEELTTVNEELRIRNAEQNTSNSDLRKLLESINVPLVMVGKDLRIRWFTAAMEPVLNLLPNDQGRLITDLHSTLIPDFTEMLVRVVAGSEEKSIEFQRPGGGWLSPANFALSRSGEHHRWRHCHPDRHRRSEACARFRRSRRRRPCASRLVVLAMQTCR